MEDLMICIICKENIDSNKDSVTLTVKGASTINTFSQTKGSPIVAAPGCKVHIDCRRKFTNKTSHQSE